MSSRETKRRGVRGKAGRLRPEVRLDKAKDFRKES